MAILRFERVVSFTSEIKGHPATNILSEEFDSKKNWLCEKGSNKGAIILQMAKSAIINSVHIGNAYSAFVEILVGKAADSTEEFTSLVPMSNLMSPKDSASGINQNCTRLFIKSDFSAESIGKAWDRMKIVCSQPFNKQVPFGLCFVQVHVEEDISDSMPRNSIEKLLKHKPESEIKIGSFFKKKINFDESQTTPSRETSSQSEKESFFNKPNFASSSDESKEELNEKRLENKQEKASKLIVSEERKAEKTCLRQKRKDESETRNKISTKKRKEEKEKRPFEKLMEDVVFALSGFQNPLRGNLRNLALEMGAGYSPDWRDHCTHLICACENTPKFKQVRGKGKIVRKEWLEKCHADRKRYPWRRFALEKKDLKAPESEDEIEEEKKISPSQSPKKSLIKNVGKLEEKISKSKKGGKGKSVNPKDSSMAVVKDNEEYSITTDEDERSTVEDTSDFPMPHLPNIFSGKTFYVDSNLQSRPLLERYIIAYDGILCEELNDKTQFYFTDKNNRLLNSIKKKFPKIIVVEPSWIQEINSKKAFISPEYYLIK